MPISTICSAYSHSSIVGPMFIDTGGQPMRMICICYGTKTSITATIHDVAMNMKDNSANL